MVHVQGQDNENYIHTYIYTHSPLVFVSIESSDLITFLLVLFSFIWFANIEKRNEAIS